MFNVLVLGSGGREHALCWSLISSPFINNLICAPGNGGIAKIATCKPLDLMDFDSVINMCKQNNINFVVVGPEAPLVGGLVDRLNAEGIRSFGPTAAASALEGSKGFTKDLCKRNNIPTAFYGRFTEAKAAYSFIAKYGAPIVVKADGLAAGKGVIMAKTIEEANSAVDDILRNYSEVIIEEWLRGEEVSYFVLVDGENILPLTSAQDHKRVGEGDTGPNTGGMGAYSPSLILTSDMQSKIMSRIIRPTVDAMKNAGSPYKGILYAGLMITDDGPQLLEYNVRFGDPECQVLLLRLKSDLFTLLLATANGTLNEVNIEWYTEVALCVVMAANGYPGDYEKNTVIANISEAQIPKNITIFHAGTVIKEDILYATGGRVLGITALGKNIAEARKDVYNAINKIDWTDGFYRRDIGYQNPL